MIDWYINKNILVKFVKILVFFKNYILWYIILIRYF